MNDTNMTLTAQRALISISGLQTAYLAYSYANGSLNNRFPVLEKLFNADSSLLFTNSGCWQSMMPFVASTYLSITLISILCLFFSAGKELRLMLVGLASVHAVMAVIRLTLAPTELYQDGAAAGASTVQFVMAGLLMVSASLPYPARPGT